MTLDEFHDLKVWHDRHAGDRPLEGRVWNSVLTLWMIGWVGPAPAWVLGADVLAACTLGLLLLPSAYVAIRRHLHRQRRLRCDWIAALRH